jgi:DNA repair protein RecO (recombination protein O)
MLLQGENQIKNRLFSTSYYFRIEAVHKNKGTLEHFKEIKISSPFQTTFRYLKVHRDVHIEILHHSIHEEEENEALFLF